MKRKCHQGTAEGGDRLFFIGEGSFRPLAVQVGEPAFKVAEIGEHGARLVEE
jgi:hypothetical protein